ncbi:MAG: hypothetical protein ACR2OI_06580 [Acidimicrobiia bacterium]
MSWLRRLRALTFIMALALVATACGGGGDDSGDDPTTTTTSAGDGGGSDGGSDGDGSSDPTTTTTTAPPSVSGDSDSDYCDRVRQGFEEQSGLDFNFIGKTPQEIQELFETNLRLFEEWQDHAPREIEDDAAVMVEAFRSIVERGNELEWDLQALASDPVFGALDTAEVEAAGDRLDAYSLEVCGVDFSELDGSGGDAGPGSDEPQDAVTILLGTFGIPASFFSEEDIECLREELGPEFEAKITADYVLTPEDTALLGGALEACEISFG